MREKTDIFFEHSILLIHRLHRGIIGIHNRIHELEKLVLEQRTRDEKNFLKDFLVVFSPTVAVLSLFISILDLPTDWRIIVSLVLVFSSITIIGYTVHNILTKEPDLNITEKIYEFILTSDYMKKHEIALNSETELVEVLDSYDYFEQKSVHEKNISYYNKMYRDKINDSIKLGKDILRQNRIHEIPAISQYLKRNNKAFDEVDLSQILKKLAIDDDNIDEKVLKEFGLKNLSKVMKRYQLEFLLQLRQLAKLESKLTK